MILHVLKVSSVLSKMEETKSELNLKTKISFSVESLLSTKSSSSPKYERNDELSSADNEDQHLSEVNERLKISDTSLCDEDEEDENITVDEDTDDMESRESLSPNSSHTVIIPQPLHPSIPRIMSQGPPPHWSFPWVGHGAILRSTSPQSMYFLCLEEKLII